MACIYRKEGKNINELDTLATYVLVGAILGARFGHILFYDPLYYLQHPVEILPIRLSPSFEFTGLSGLASHGGGVGIFIAIFLYCRKYKEHYIQLLDKTAIAVALVGAFIRFGNLINSEIIGIPTNVPWRLFLQRLTNCRDIPHSCMNPFFAFFCLCSCFMFGE
jgi:phosphatidylglycerol:prolipoprotein diacylglycerol transferase